MNLGAPELIIILVIALLLFGGAKLPKLARSLGEAQKEFKSATDDLDGTSSSSASAPTEVELKEAELRAREAELRAREAELRHQEEDERR